jgi:arylsulfatase A-like enzyme
VSQRPNFLFIITDQHRPDHTGFGGNPLLRTPHLDSIAARATRFERAFVANPICMPNRSTILTGRLPSVHGTRFNGIPLDWSAQTFVRELREAGYRTRHVGKLHLQNLGDGGGVAQAAMRSWRPGDSLRSPHPAGWDRYEDQTRHRGEHVKMPGDYYGFEHVDLIVNHADYASGHYYQWLLEQGVDPTRLQGRENALPYEPEMKLQVWRTALPEELYPTHYVALRTVEQLEKLAGHDAPFFLHCSFPDPHHPFTPPGRYFELYDPADVPLPETWDDSHAHSLPHYRALLEARGEQNFLMAPFSPTETQYREAAAAEYGAIAMIDDAVGEILAALERLALAESTVIVFTSDHGDMFGDHAMMLKAGMHYEGCTRVPLLIATPGRSPAVSRSLASSLDLAQTLLELAGCAEYHGLQGQSLVPILDDSAAVVRDHVLVEEDEIFDLARLGRPLRMRTLLTERARLSLYQGTDAGELFDLERDPDELHNIFDLPEGRALRTDMTEKLARQLMAYADESPRPRSMA